MGTEKIKALALAAGERMLLADRRGIDPDAKEGHANFVTKYDKAIELFLREGLQKILPEAAFYGEETASGAFPDSEYVFVVDPIDGTSNFIKDLKWSCVAISLTKNRERILGAVYNPYARELFWAVKGEGAFLNDTKIHVSKEPLERGIAVFGTAPYYDDVRPLAMEKAKEYLEKCIDIRRTGSAELDLCLVACGRAELYFEPRLQPWDFAAGSLIVEEAGGIVSHWDGSALDITKAGDCMAFGSGIDLAKL